mmetsp:Transcript_6641/g.13169  ORF Transcript_6641/g.13169 Transcript_6641/m.13169 type:complete len:289 (-) Transcript_6641:141-1007(-)
MCSIQSKSKMPTSRSDLFWCCGQNDLVLVLIALDDVVGGVAHHGDLAPNNSLDKLAIRFHDDLKVKTADGVVVSSIVERSRAFAGDVNVLSKIRVDLLDSCTAVCEVLANSLVITTVLARPHPVKLSQGHTDSVLELEGEKVGIPVLEILEVDPASGILRHGTGPINGIVNSRSVVVDDIPDNLANLFDDRRVNSINSSSLSVLVVAVMAVMMMVAMAVLVGSVVMMALVMSNFLVFVARNDWLPGCHSIAASNLKVGRGQEVLEIAHCVVRREPLGEGVPIGVHELL